MQDDNGGQRQLSPVPPLIPSRASIPIAEQTQIGSFSTLKLGIDNALPHGTGKGIVVFDGGTLDMHGDNQSVNGGRWIIGTITNNVCGRCTLTADADTDSDFAGSSMDTGTGSLAR